MNYIAATVLHQHETLTIRYDRRV